MTHHTALIDAAKKLAMECIDDGETLQPFLMTEGGRGSILSIVGENSAQQLSIAQRVVDDLPPEASVWAFAYDGYLTLDEEKTDAIFIEVGVRSAFAVTVYVQRYAPASPGVKVKLIGSLGRVSKMPSRLKNQQFCGSRKEANQASEPTSEPSPGGNGLERSPEEI